MNFQDVFPIPSTPESDRPMPRAANRGEAIDMHVIDLLRQEKAIAEKIEELHKDPNGQISEIEDLEERQAQLNKRLRDPKELRDVGLAYDITTLQDHASVSKNAATPELQNIVLHVRGYFDKGPVRGHEFLVEPQTFNPRDKFAAEEAARILTAGVKDGEVTIIAAQQPTSIAEDLAELFEKIRCPNTGAQLYSVTIQPHINTRDAELGKTSQKASHSHTR